MAFNPQAALIAALQQQGGIQAPQLQHLQNRPQPSEVMQRQQMAEILAQQVPMPQTQPGMVAPVDATMVGALGNIGTDIWVALNRRKQDQGTEALMADELAMSEGRNPFEQELQPVTPPSLRGVAPMEGPGFDQALQAQQEGIPAFARALDATHQVETDARRHHDQAALLNPQTSALAYERMFPEPAASPGVADIDPAKFTPESVQRAQQTGDYSQLEPIPQTTPAGPSAVQEYQFYAEQTRASGQEPLPYEQWDMQRRGASRQQTTVNVGGSEVGPIPAGHELFTDPETGARSMRQIPGSPAEQEQIAEAERAQSRAASRQTIVQTAVDDGARAMEALSQMHPSMTGDGLVASQLRKTLSTRPGTEAYRADTYYNSLKDNVVLDAINQMREGSAAGATGFGNMNTRQFETLQGWVGRLDIGLPIEDQKYLLQRISNTLIDNAYGSRAERAYAIENGLTNPMTGQPWTQEDSAAIDSLYVDYTGRGAGSAFDEGGAPILQQTQPAGAAQISTEDEYDALPSGAEFIAPDGSRRRKP